MKTSSRGKILFEIKRMKRTDKAIFEYMLLCGVFERGH